MPSLNSRKCIPCSGETPPLELAIKDKLMKEVDSSWEFKNDKKRIERKIKFKDFSQSIELANRIGKIADEQWHHPELIVGFGHLDIEIWTHKIDNLVESDFIFAAKCDLLIQEYLEELKNA